MRTYSLLAKKIKNIIFILSGAVLISSSLLAYVVHAAVFTDTYEPNNSLEEATFLVAGEDYDSYISGFYDEDGLTDVIDLSILSSSYNLNKDDEGYDERLDLNLDGKIDIYDITLLLKYIQ